MPAGTCNRATEARGGGLYGGESPSDGEWSGEGNFTFFVCENGAISTSCTMI